MDENFEIQNGDDIRNIGLEEMRRQKVLLASELKSIDAQISDLAFNNYGTYADSGRATHDCSKTFGEMRDKTVNLSEQAEQLTTAFQEFRTKARALAEEQELVRRALDKSNPIWELLTLPSRMDVCIRAGYYDLAYTLTNYGMQLQQQTQLYKNPLIKQVADRLVEARSYLLEELFNKFAGPLDLAESIKVVNNVRKMPYLTANQLRIAVLQHRDIYLEKQILDISGSTDMIVQAIEIYRTSMYDTLVLYLAVFPENEIIRKDPNADPRWESWPILPPNSILSQWVIANVKNMLDLITKTDIKSHIDISTVWQKLMAMASSFGRMGIDFRPLVSFQLTKLVEQRFRQKVREATHKLTGSSREIVMSGIDPTSWVQPDFSTDTAPTAAPELSVWNDLTAFANSVVESLNGLRFLLTPVILSTVVVSLRDSVRSILTWLATSHSHSANFSRAIRIVCTCLAPFFEKCIVFFFPPKSFSEIFGPALTKQQYLQFIEIDVGKLAASCDASKKIEEIVRPLLQKRTLADIDLNNVLKGKKTENSPPAKFFLEGSPEEENGEEDKEVDNSKIKQNENNAVTFSSKLPEEVSRDDLVEESSEVELIISNSAEVESEDHKPILPNQKIVAEPHLDSIPEHIDTIIPNLPTFDIDPLENAETVQDGSTNMQIEEEEGWSWEEDNQTEEKREVKPTNKKNEKDD